MKRTFLSLSAAMILGGACFASPHATTKDDKLANCTVVIVRHAEKPLEGRELTKAGEARAKAYVGYFEHLQLDGSAWKPTHIFAAADSEDSERPRLTLTPFSEAIHMPLDLRFGSKKVDEIADDLKSHSYGKRILICWRHGKIPALLEALGADPAPLFPTGKWPEETFDWLIEVHFDSKGVAHPSVPTLIHEHLMPGDSS